MASNFLINYFSKEGSSAIISSISAQKGIHVPLFEELDRYLIDPSDSLPGIGDVMRGVFKAGKLQPKPKYNFVLQNKESCEDYQSLGFKWRFWGPVKELAAIAKECDVKIFILSRRDLLAQACSHYIEIYGENQINKGKFIAHPQFVYSYPDNPDKKMIMQDLQNQQFSFAKDDFLECLEIRLFAKTQQANMAQELAHSGVGIEHIYYEDFCHDKDKFIRDFLAKIGLNAAEEINPFCALSKPRQGPISEKIKDFDMIVTSEPMKSKIALAKQEYASQLDLLDILSKKKGDGRTIPPSLAFQAHR